VDPDDFEDVEVRATRADADAYRRIWGWCALDRGEERFLRHLFRRAAGKQSHRPKRGRFRGWRGH